MDKINATQLVYGMMKYLGAEIIPCVEDTFTKLVLKTLAVTAENNAPAYAKAVDGFIAKPFISDILKAESGSFEIESIIDALRQAVNECGELTVKSPAVKFLSPQEKTLRFTASDISSLKQYLTNAIAEV